MNPCEFKHLDCSHCLIKWESSYKISQNKMRKKSQVKIRKEKLYHGNSFTREQFHKTKSVIFWEIQHKTNSFYFVYRSHRIQSEWMIWQDFVYCSLRLFIKMNTSYCFIIYIKKKFCIYLFALFFLFIYFSFTEPTVHALNFILSWFNFEWLHRYPCPQQRSNDD